MPEINEDKLVSANPKEAIEILLKAISRYDFYINSTNTKASLILGWNGVVIGTVLLKFDSLLSLYPKPPWVSVIAVALLLSLGLCSVLSIFLAFRVVNPFLTPGPSADTQSLFFFGSVAQMSVSNYSQGIKSLSSDILLSDLIQQSHVLAQGLKKKMDDTRKSVWAIYGSILCLILLLLLKGVIIYVPAL